MIEKLDPMVGARITPQAAQDQRIITKLNEVIEVVNGVLLNLSGVTKERSKTTKTD